MNEYSDVIERFELSNNTVKVTKVLVNSLQEDGKVLIIYSKVWASIKGDKTVFKVEKKGKTEKIVDTLLDPLTTDEITEIRETIVRSLDKEIEKLKEYHKDFFEFETYLFE